MKQHGAAMMTSRAARSSRQANHGHAKGRASQARKKKGAAVEAVSDPSVETLRVVVTNRGTACRGIFRRQTHYLGCVHSNIFRGGAVWRGESGRAGHFIAVTVTSVVPEVDIESNPHKRGPGTRAHLRRRCDLSTPGLALNCSAPTQTPKSASLGPTGMV